MPKQLRNIVQAELDVTGLQDDLLVRLKAVGGTMINNPPSVPPPFDGGCGKPVRMFPLLANMLPGKDGFIDTDAALSTNRKRSRSVVPRLVSRNKGGGRYVRHPRVKAEIQRLLGLGQSQWRGQAADLQNETLVCLIHLMRDDNSEVRGALIWELLKRVRSRARKHRAGTRKFDMEQFASNAEMHVLKLVLSKEPSRERDFLEMRFGWELKNLLNKLWGQFKDSVGDIVEIRRWSPGAHDEPEDGEITRQALEQVADPAAGPLDNLLNIDMTKRRHRLLQRLLAAVTDPRHLKAVILHYAHGIPIASSKRGKDCLTRRFRKEQWEIKQWIATAMKEMRAALDVYSIDSI